MMENTNAVKRLVSLDVLRGLTVMFMIFVNNGAGEEIFSTLQHSKWNGMTPCDLVFPFFLFSFVNRNACFFQPFIPLKKISKRTTKQNSGYTL